MYEWEDFYNEPSEFDQQVDEFKESLMTAVKDEFKAEMERLRKENAELQDVKNNFEQTKNEYEAKKREFDYEKQNLKRTVRGERLTDLLKDFHIIAYRARSKTVKGPKCDKCDERRQITFNSPTGKELKEDCQCSKGKTVYEPEEHEAAEFTINHDGTGVSIWYARKYQDSDRYHSTDHAEHIYKKGTSFESLGHHWRVFFRNKEECQAYCDWLTEKEANTHE